MKVKKYIGFTFVFIIFFILNSKVNANWLDEKHNNTPSDWATSAVEEAKYNYYVPYSLLNSYTKPITREEFCELMSKFYEETRNEAIRSYSHFKDTDNIDVNKMASLGVVNGVSAELFNPSATITREMAAVMLSRLAKVMGIPLKNNLPQFIDNELISNWAIEHVGKMQGANIMIGNEFNNFNPKQSFTREQSIATIMRLTKEFIPVEKIQLPETCELTRKSYIDALKVTIYPSNATDRRIQWYSSNVDVFEVDEFDGTICGNGKGEAILTAVSPNGVSATCTITVSPLYTELKNPSVTELNVLRCKSFYSMEDYYDYVPEEPQIAGKIIVTDIKEYDGYYPKAKVTVKLAEIVEGYNEGEILDAFFNPYIKWRLIDKDGTTIENGLEKLDLEKVGDETTVKIEFKKIRENQKYFLEFKNDDGELFEYKKDEPKVVGVNFPSHYEKITLVDKNHIVNEFYKVEMKLKYEILYGYGYDYYDPIFYVYGISNGKEYGSDYFDVEYMWRLLDSNGTEIELGKEVINSYEVSYDGKFVDKHEPNIELKANEVYYFEIIPGEWTI